MQSSPLPLQRVSTDSSARSTELCPPPMSSAPRRGRRNSSPENNYSTTRAELPNLNGSHARGRSSSSRRRDRNHRPKSRKIIKEGDSTAERRGHRDYSVHDSRSRDKLAPDQSSSHNNPRSVPRSHTDRRPRSQRNKYHRHHTVHAHPNRRPPSREPDPPRTDGHRSYRNVRSRGRQDNRVHEYTPQLDFQDSARARRNSASRELGRYHMNHDDTYGQVAGCGQRAALRHSDSTRKEVAQVEVVGSAGSTGQSSHGFNIFGGNATGDHDLVAVEAARALLLLSSDNRHRVSASRMKSGKRSDMPMIEQDGKREEGEITGHTEICVPPAVTCERPVRR
ncbi:hypothetical protein M413DRAFT_26575 [Hebeloma cylindrosporum]|uniref:Uncharacterized protein n=1 Tax=Hebeloma cylindrosporum TaxID=76867 RepID=A0A0C2XXZ4_HEBCY|nr:hypothetical protein M413DRAFT_26575 [Hebeloma cylindrosporum h7]